MIFDTDVLIWATRGDASAARTITQAQTRVISVVSLMELLVRARSRIEARQIQRSLVDLQFRIIPLSEVIGSVAVALVAEHALSSGIGLADALIASTAIEAGLPLCTANLKHFRPIRTLTCVPFRR